MKTSEKYRISILDLEVIFDTHVAATFKLDVGEFYLGRELSVGTFLNLVNGLQEIKTKIFGDIDKDIKIEDVDGISDRVKSILWRAGVITVPQLKEIPLYRLSCFAGIGEKALEEITEFLSKNNDAKQ